MRITYNIRLLYSFIIFIFSLQITDILYSQEAIIYKDTSINVEFVSFKSFDEVSLNGLVFIPQNKSNLPAIIVHHGFGGMKDSFCSRAYTPCYDGANMAVAEELAKAGFFVLVYDQRGAGESGGYLSLEDRIKDVPFVIEFIKKYPYINKNKIGLFGHSLGSYIGAIASAIYKDIKAAALWSTPASFDYILSEILNANIQYNVNFGNILYNSAVNFSKLVEPVIEKPHVILNKRVPNLLDSIGVSLSFTGSFRNFEIGGSNTFGVGASDKGVYIIFGNTKLSIYDLVRAVVDSKVLNPQLYIGEISPRPILLVNGTDDMIVPHESAELLYSLAGEPKELVLIENTGHMYREPENKVDTVIKLTVDWFVDNL